MNRLCQAIVVLLAAVWVSPALIAADSTGSTPANWQRFEFRTPEQLATYFETQAFTPELWRAGERSVPRLYLDDIPARWGSDIAPSLEVKSKKRGFLFVLAPMVLAANEEISLDRKRLEALFKDQNSGTAVSGKQQEWLRALAARYGIDGDLQQPAVQQQLLAKVDEVPPSLVLAQAANESGWGTSRFAAQGNALFGQWTWSGKGITPQEQRTATKGNYKVRAFESPLDSVRAYLLNLNTHSSYAALRQQRLQMRQAGKPLNVSELAAGLIRYSERGEEYVKELRAMIRINNLETADSAILRDMTPVLLVPVGEGAH